MSGILKALKYSLFYEGIMIIFYYLGVYYCYKLNLTLIAIIPVNFLAIKYGILKRGDYD